jgi:peptidoglycan/LPS O-acetylase OafA/YrhL
VDVFFVISGYLITGIILKKLKSGRFSYSEFFGRRVRRIGPALVVVLLVTLALGFLILPSGDFRELGLEASAASVFFANILFWLQAGYFDDVSRYKPLLHLWSLGVEEQFYLIWPALLMLAAVLGVRWRAIVLFVIVVSFAANVALVTAYPEATFYLLPTRLWELGLGGVLAWHHGRKIGTKLANPAPRPPRNAARRFRPPGVRAAARSRAQS